MSLVTVICNSKPVLPCPHHFYCVCWGMGGGVMSKVGMCCDCSWHYTEQGSKSCRKQDLLKKMACLWVLINSVPVFQGEQRKQKSHVGRSAKTLFIMTSYQWKNSQSALLFVSTSFFFGIPNLRHWNNWHFFQVSWKGYFTMWWTHLSIFASIVEGTDNLEKKII